MVGYEGRSDHKNENRHSIVILFGAGASYGATHIEPHEPPLGNQLYRQLAVEFPNSWGPNGRLGQRYRASIEQDFERAMFYEVKIREPAICVVEWYREMAYYFSQFLPDNTGKDCYTRLFSSLGELHETTAFATLNYDCLFDHVVWRAGRRIAHTRDEDVRGSIPILKIHGGCNLVSSDLSNARAFLTNPGSGNGCELEYIPPIRIRALLESQMKRFMHRYPVLSWYSTAKNSPLAGQVIQGIRNWWAELARRASTIAVIGVRHVADDRHVIEPIRESQASRMVYIGGDSDFQQWRSANDQFEHLGEKFEDSLEALCSTLKKHF